MLLLGNLNAFALQSQRYYLAISMISFLSYCLAQKDFFISREVIAPNKLLFYLILNALEQTGAQADGGGVHRGKTLADERRNVFQHVLIVCCDETG